MASTPPTEAFFPPTSNVAIKIENEEDAVLYVGNLGLNVTEEELYRVLEGTAAVVSIAIPRHIDCLPAGYALVQLTSRRAAEKALASCSKLELGGRRITMWVQSSALCPHESHIRGSDTLLIDNLALSTTEATIYKFISQAGTVLKTLLARDSETGKSLGYGYVQMASPQEAARALNILRNLDIDSQRCRICSCLPPLNFI